MFREKRGVSERLFLFFLPPVGVGGMLRIGDLIEVLASAYEGGGETGIVRSLHRGTAIVDRVVVLEGGRVRQLDRPLRIDVGRLTRVPWPAEIRTAKRRFREEHLAKLKPRAGYGPTNIRVYPADMFYRDGWIE